jgi:TRAP transporter TAXI family solute receptor
MSRHKSLGIKRRTLLGGACVAGLTAAAWPVSIAFRQELTIPPGRLRISTGGVGGVYYAYGTGIVAAVRARLPQLAPEVIVTAASIENIRLVTSGQAEMGFTLADSAGTAHFGAPPFLVPTKVAALARLYDNYLHLVVNPDRPLRTVADLRGQRVSVGASGSGTELTATRLLAEAGLNASTDLRVTWLGVDDSAAAFAAGNLDAFFFSGGIPTLAIDALAKWFPIRLMDLGSMVSPLRHSYGEVYAERTIPGSTYGLGAPVTTVGVPNYLVVSPTMDSDLAYAIIETLFVERALLAAAHPEGRRLDRGAAINTYPLQLHPGAERYYRAIKP